MIRLFVRTILLVLLTHVSMSGQRVDAREYERPYFMPPAERERLHGLISHEAWSRAVRPASLKFTTILTSPVISPSIGRTRAWRPRLDRRLGKVSSSGRATKC